MKPVTRKARVLNALATKTGRTAQTICNIVNKKYNTSYTPHDVAKSLSELKQLNNQCKIEKYVTNANNQQVARWILA
jgi:transposase